MDNQSMNFGSGSELLGGGNQALNEAISRRNQGQAGATAQVSPAAPTSVNQVPPMPPSSPSPASTVTPAASQLNMGGSAGLQGGLPINTPESELIIKALDQRLRALSKIQGA